MALLHARHSDPTTAALSIAASRASKCKMIRAEAAASSDAEYAATLVRMADKSAERLFYDVREWISSTVAGTNASDQTCERLHEIVESAR